MSRPTRTSATSFATASSASVTTPPSPPGAFYIFPHTPIPDDLALIRLLLNEGILAVPGSGFDRPGYMRLTLTVPRDTVERSLPGFA